VGCTSTPSSQGWKWKCRYKPLLRLLFLHCSLIMVMTFFSYNLLRYLTLSVQAAPPLNWAPSQKIFEFALHLHPWLYAYASILLTEFNLHNWRNIWECFLNKICSISNANEHCVKPWNVSCSCFAFHCCNVAVIGNDDDDDDDDDDGSGGDDV